MNKQIIKGFKVRIYPDEEQEKLLHYYCDINHKAWNKLVAYFKDKMENDEKFKIIVGNFGIKDFSEKDLESLFETDEFYNIKCHNRVWKNVLSNYSKAWTRCYKKINNSKQPKFHKYNPKKKSFGVASQTYKLEHGIPLPKAREITKQILKQNFNINLKTTYIPVNKTFLEKFNIKEVIDPKYTYHRGKWYLSGSYKVSIEQEKSEVNLGLDWGIKDFMTDSNGAKHNYPLSVIRQFYRINKLKSKLSKKEKQKQSNNWKKLSNKLDLAYERFTNLKRDFIEQTTAELSKYNVAVEELENAKILMSNKNRRRLMMIAPRYQFINRLQQKCEQKGNTFKKVNPAYTSLTCSKCGQVKEKLSLKQREFICDCGLHIDRDINAAINIATRAFC